ncbi:SIFamide-related peptide isoform X1 [Cephus cinctus]|uniref:SIFamide-related peptide isoform X1 n=1 Tax=Cephus cinctus TaxID=211228 RepID=A0AAJ7RJ68_CEPCN|nr:SIFamide-related peptide isoform X1 [Cephus cinctus]XP_024941475.1 SIFamide-related peptide isoform X1 [Cephus cinctus]
MVSIRVILTIFAVLATVAVLSVNAAYRKPPFNGSIFGKRSSTVTDGTDYEVTGRALTAMCEVASETCSAWFAHQETN